MKRHIIIGNCEEMYFADDALGRRTGISTICYYDNKVSWCFSHRCILLITFWETLQRFVSSVPGVQRGRGFWMEKLVQCILKLKIVLRRNFVVTL
ncbi:hypothetical protein NPIL_327251 [Nephila pilipes]|uniref:Uncharacterized protein n=1 Tax=Nephila pilipes TaxID=299642 RepID=A0A8X6TP58_NEPPI|nr:hypothetical protein NPIL_327251 [Nephila pilipes]